MKISIRKLVKLSIHTFVLTVVLIGALLFWLVVTMKGNMRPLGSPPIGYEDRKKYVTGNIPGLPGFDNIPVDLWFGKRPGQYDTTHFRIASDYITLRPLYHGESAHFMLVWPSLRSVDEEDMIRKKEGLPPVNGSEYFTVILSELHPPTYAGGDGAGPYPSSRCEPLIQDEARGVKYCKENRYDDVEGTSWTNYWPIDDSILTPWHKNPPRFGCYLVVRPDGGLDRCTSDFTYNKDVAVLVYASKAQAVDIVKNFSRLTKFLATLEVTP